MSNQDRYKLFDNKELSQYEFHMDGLVPRVKYDLSDNNVIYLTYAEVPPELGGKGIGSRIVKKVLEDVKSRGLKVVPTCGFIAAYVSRNPEWQGLLAETN